MKGLKNFLLLLIVTMPFAGVASGAEEAPAKPAKAEKERVATIVETNGESTEVYDLKIRYEAHGLWSGPTPSDTRDAVVFRKTCREGRILTDPIYKSIELAEIRKIAKLAPVVIELQDGSIIRKSEKNRWVVIKRNNAISTELEPDNCQTEINAGYVGGSTKDGSSYLEGFTGRAKTRGGDWGTYYIKLQDVKEIIFADSGKK